MKTHKITTSILALGLFLPSLSYAVMFCSEPSAPFCIRTGFTGDFEFEDCKLKMKTYLRNVDEYRQCLKEESDSAVEEANKAIKKFNCYASGEKFCL